MKRKVLHTNCWIMLHMCETLSFTYRYLVGSYIKQISQTTNLRKFHKYSCNNELIRSEKVHDRNRNIQCLLRLINKASHK